MIEPTQPPEEEDAAKQPCPASADGKHDWRLLSDSPLHIHKRKRYLCNDCKKIIHLPPDQDPPA